MYVWVNYHLTVNAKFIVDLENLKPNYLSQQQLTTIGMSF
jgi:hypothetical protein